jgi:O-antigen/teichoic acid export membrane protein
VDEMADEEKKTDGKKLLSTMIKVVLGLGFLILGVLTILRWWPQLVEIIKGCIGLFLILAGIITLAIAKE